MHFLSHPSKNLPVLSTSQVWLQAPQHWQVPKVHHAALEHQQAYKNSWDQQFNHALQSHQQLHSQYTQDHNLPQAQQMEGHFYHQNLMCNAGEQEEQARHHQAYQEGGLGAQSQVHPGHVMHQQATQDGQMYTRTSQSHQVQQAGSRTVQAHQLQRNRFPVQLTSAAQLSGYETHCD